MCTDEWEILSEVVDELVRELEPGQVIVFVPGGPTSGSGRRAGRDCTSPMCKSDAQSDDTRASNVMCDAFCTCPRHHAELDAADSG